MNDRFKKIILLLGDVVVLYLCLFLTLVIRYFNIPTKELWQEHLPLFSIIFIGWLIVFYIVNLYNLKVAVSNSHFFRRIVQGFVIATIFSVLFFYFYPLKNITPKTNLAIFVVIFFVSFILWRKLFNWLLKSYLPRNNIAFIGSGKKVIEIIKELKQKPHLGFKISFILDNETDVKEVEGVPVFSNIKSLPELIKSKKVSNIVLAGAIDSKDIRTTLFECLPFGISYKNITNFYEIITGKVPIESINKSWFLENLSEGDKGGFDGLKRLYDVFFSFLFLIISILFWPIIALIIKMESPGPVFFIQKRLGKNQKIFKILKFRTMRVAGNDYSPTEEKDRRITRFGNFLRKSRLDEIPQIINILKGEMSFVGPRPERVDLVKELEIQIPFYCERMLVKPGVTGWDQISGEYHSPSYEDTMKKLQYDLFYIKNRSIYLDLSIVLKTISTVISQAGR